MTNETNTPAPEAAPAPALRPVADRDLDLVERLARDLNSLHRALKKKDKNAIVELRARLTKAPDELRRVLAMARRAYSRE